MVGCMRVRLTMSAHGVDECMTAFCVEIKPAQVECDDKSSNSASIYASVICC